MDPKVLPGSEISQDMASDIAPLLALLGGSALLGIGILHFLRRRYLDTPWRPVGVLSGIRLYPLKSGAPTEVSSAYCHSLGLKHQYYSDRTFVVYEELTGSVVTARTDHGLLRIKVLPTLTENVVCFTSSSGRESIDIDLSAFIERATTIRMKFPTTDIETLDTIDCGDDAAAWISAELGRPGVRLGHWPPDFSRDISKPRARELHVFQQISNIIAGAYSNMSSYLLLNLSSVDDLASRLGPETDVGSYNFRGNILVSGAAAYAEDGWKVLRIGEASFKIVKPCVRCIMVTINPNTLKRDQNMEPLKTLKTYRQLTSAEERNIEGDSPVMGSYMGLMTPGKIKVGDIVYVSRPQLDNKIFKIFHNFRSLLYEG